MNIWGVIPVAAVVSTVVTMLLRWFDTPRPVLRVEAHMTTSDGGTGTGPNGDFWFAPATLTNVGDGNAYDVRVFGSGCDPAVATGRNRWTYKIPVLEAGGSTKIELGVVDGIENAAVIVTWSARPGRWFRRKLVLKLSEVQIEQIFPPGSLPIGEIGHPRLTCTRSLEKGSRRAQLSRRMEPEDSDTGVRSGEV